MSCSTNILYSLELYFSRENIWEDHTELTLFRAVSFPGKYLCVAQDIAGKGV